MVKWQKHLLPPQKMKQQTLLKIILTKHFILAKLQDNRFLYLLRRATSPIVFFLIAFEIKDSMSLLKSFFSYLKNHEGVKNSLKKTTTIIKIFTPNLIKGFNDFMKFYNIFADGNFYFILKKYIIDLLLKILIISGIDSWCVNSLNAMDIENGEGRKFKKSFIIEDIPVTKRRKFYSPLDTSSIESELIFDTIGFPLDSAYDPREFYKDSEHPLMKECGKHLGLSPRLQSYPQIIEKLIKELREHQINSINIDDDFFERNISFLTCSEYTYIYSPGLEDVNYKDLLINSDKLGNIINGKSGAEVSIIKCKDKEVVIKKFKDLKTGFRELIYSLIALRINPVPEKLKMTRIYDAVYSFGNNFSIIMEKAEGFDIEYWLSTNSACCALKSCAEYLALFHAMHYKRLATQNIYKEKYIPYAARFLHTLAYGQEKEEKSELFSLAEGRLFNQDEYVTGANIMQFLSPQEKIDFKTLEQGIRFKFEKNCGKIYRKIKSNPSLDKISYILTTTYGDAHINNLFFSDKLIGYGDFEISNESFLKITGIDNQSMVATCDGLGEIAEDVGRMLGSLCFWAVKQNYLETECYEKGREFQEIFFRYFLKKISRQDIISKEKWESFKKTFRENSIFYKFRFLGVICNAKQYEDIAKDRGIKLKLVRFFLREQSELITSFQNTSSPLRSPKKIRSDFLQPIKDDVSYCLPKQPEGFIETRSEGSGKSYLTFLTEELHSAGAKSHSCAITGMAGVGKTSLALQYAYEALKNKAYNLIYWVESETEYSLLKGYKNLLLVMGVSLKDLDDASVIELFKSKLSTVNRCLLLYDNADPKLLTGKVPDNVHSVFTSRCGEGWSVPLINLSVFSPVEAIIYLLGVTGLEANDENERTAEMLAKELGYLPIALSHSASSIKLEEGKNVTGNSFIKYINEFKKNSTKDAPLYFDEHQNFFKKERQKITYENLVGKTLEIARKQVSGLAEKILVYSSYLDPDFIPENIFSWARNNEQLEKALSQLESLSLIKRVNKGVSFSIHRLVQLVIRDKEESKDVDQLLFSDLLSFFNDSFLKNTFCIKNSDKLVDDLPHFIKMFSHLQRLKIDPQPIDYIENLKWAGRVLHVIEETALTINNKKEGNTFDFLSMCFDNSTEDNIIPNWIENNPHPKVQFTLGFMFNKGFGVKRDLKKSRFYYKQAANKGDVDAQFFLGQMYDSGNYAEDEKAVKWYTEAAKQGDACALESVFDYAKHGNTEAQFNLGVLYTYGWGIENDTKQACKWIRRAARRGHHQAIAALALQILEEGVEKLGETEIEGLGEIAVKEDNTGSMYILGTDIRWF